SQSLAPVYQHGSGRFVVDYEIGGDIERADFLARPTDIALDSRGNLFVLDAGNYCIKKFDPSGKLLGSFGRKGEGPGEIEFVTGMGFDREDRLVVYDHGNNRFTVFANTGVFVKTAGINEIGWRSVLGMNIDPKGRLYIESSRTHEWSPKPDTWTVISRVDLDTMTETPVDSASFKSFYWRQDGDTRTGASAPYCPELHWGVAPSGDIVLANSADYSIKIIAQDLSLRREVRPTRARYPVTDKNKEEYFSGFEGENLLIWLRQTVEFPKFMPYFDRLLIDGDGYLLFLVEEPTDSTHLYEVFTPAGEFVNRVTLPRLSRGAILAGKFIYTIARGEEDPVVRRYRLE
ncbi:MAG: hypothetical protein H6Q78_1092, partial [Candidatus Krumholzibacteriota bacterium]|nr:hypothetical protein [Candidatus Krumholzibacteriota bacterium]